jgi:prepilin-type processing-associated H-X9-DG protein
VQKVRETATRAECQNNVKQLGIAAHSFHDSNKRFPPAVEIAAIPAGLTSGAAYQTLVSASRSPGFGPNWAVYLLPYIEQGALFSSINPQNYMSSNGGDQSWRNIRGAVIPTFKCAADASDRTPFALNGGNWARGNYAANAGPGWFNGSLNGLASSTPLSFTSAPTWGGVMGINWGAKLSDISQQDGTSATVLFCEVRVGFGSNDRRGVWAMGLAGSSVTAANGSTGDCPTPNDSNPKSDDIEDCQQIPNHTTLGATHRMGCSWDNAPQNWPNWQAQARSLHPGGVNVSFCDGSVRMVYAHVTPAVWDMIISRNDGLAYDHSFDN